MILKRKGGCFESWNLESKKSSIIKYMVYICKNALMF